MDILDPLHGALQAKGTGSAPAEIHFLDTQQHVYKMVTSNIFPLFVALNPLGSCSSGWWANFQQCLFLPLWLNLRRISGLWREQSSLRQRYFLSLLLALGCVEVDCLRVGLSRCRCPIGHIDVDTEWPHDVHANEAGRRFQAHNNYKTGSAASLAPLDVEMLSSAGNLQGSTVCTVHCPLKLLQGTPLGAVAPPDGKPETGYGSSREHKTEDGDVFQSELACDGWPYSSPNRGNLGLTWPP